MWKDSTGERDMSAASKYKTVRKPQPVAKARRLLLTIISLAVLTVTFWLLRPVKPANDLGSAVGRNDNGFHFERSTKF